MCLPNEHIPEKVARVIFFVPTLYTLATKLPTTLVYIRRKTMSVKYIPSYTPRLYSKAGGIQQYTFIFLISAPKHRLWVLVRTASSRCTHNQCFLRQKKLMIFIVHVNLIITLSLGSIEKDHVISEIVL